MLFRRFPSVLLIFIMVFLTTACSVSSTPAPAPSQAAAPSAPTPAPTPAKIKMALGGLTLSWLTVYVADGLGYFKDEALEIEFNYVAGAAAVGAAVMGRQADMGAMGVNAVYAAAVQGRDIKVFAVLSHEPTVGLTLTNKAVAALAAKGVTPSSPIDVRVKALKGLRIGANPPGSTSDITLRQTLVAYGVDPDKEVTIVPIADSNSLIATAREDRTDGFLFGAPVSDVPVAEKWGQKWVSYPSGDVPSQANQLFVAMGATQDYMDKNPEVVTRFTRALWRATESLKKDPIGSRDGARKHFPEMNVDVFNAAFEAVTPGYLAGPLATEVGFANSFALWAATQNPKPALSFQQAIDTKFATATKPK